MMKYMTMLYVYAVVIKLGAHQPCMTGFLFICIQYKINISVHNMLHNEHTSSTNLFSSSSQLRSSNFSLNNMKAISTMYVCTNTVIIDTMYICMLYFLD